MNPQVTAAWIAAIVSLVSLTGTVVVAIIGFRISGKTLAEQHIRTLNERFATAADRLGNDKPAAVQLAGVYAMAGLADDWPENRQTCINVLCAYLRLPYEPDPGQDAPEEQRAFQATQEVRHTIIRVITARLQKDAPVSWQGMDFDFRFVIFDGGNFDGAEFSGGTVTFAGAEFSGGWITFSHGKFSGSMFGFGGAKFSGSEISFKYAEFSGAGLSSGMVEFVGVEFSGSDVSFNNAKFSGTALFANAKFSSGTVSFLGVGFSGSRVDFDGAEFSGSEVSFNNAEFSGGRVDFSNVADWSHPPVFGWSGTPPAGVLLPKEAGHSPS